MAFCMNCGKQLPSGAKFCYECGAAIKAPDHTSAASAENADVEIGISVLLNNDNRQDFTQNEVYLAHAHKTELLCIKCNSVGKSCSDSKHNVGAMRRNVCRVEAVHTDKSEVMLLAVSEHACRHQGICRGNICLFDKLAKLVACAREAHAAAKANEGALTAIDKLGDLLDVALDINRIQYIGNFLYGYSTVLCRKD